MPKRDHLVQEARVDKTGKVTKRWVKPAAQPAMSSMPAPKLITRSNDSAEKERFAKIAAGMKPLRKREIDDSPEKWALVEKVNARFTELGLTKTFQAGYNEQAALERPADLIASLDNLLSHPKADLYLAQKLQDRFRSLTNENLRDWMEVAEKNFWPLREQLGTYGTNLFDPTSEIISGYLHMKNAMKYEKKVEPTEQQCRNFLWAQRSAFGTNLEGERVHEGGGLGVSAYIKNDDLHQFIIDNDDEDRLQRVASVLYSGNLSRFTEVLAVADGNTVAPLADGAL